jgi:hypothetical protein
MNQASILFPFSCVFAKSLVASFDDLLKADVDRSPNVIDKEQTSGFCGGGHIG